MSGPPMTDLVTEAERFLTTYNTPSRWNWLALLTLILVGPDLIARLTQALRDQEAK